MKRYISPTEVFITFDQRSVSKYELLLSQHLIPRFGRDQLNQVDRIREIMEECYDWTAREFVEIIERITNPLFLYCLFKYHEASINLWGRVLSGEDIGTTINVNEDTLSLNRRIFKLGLEQCINVNYVGPLQVDHASMNHFDEVIEDLLFLGSELIGYCQYLAEMRMLPGTLLCSIDEHDRFIVSRPTNIEAVFNKLVEIAGEEFRMGIFDDNGVIDFKDALQRCMNIDYDFAGHQIVYIKKHHNPHGWEFQTIESGILVGNLIANGASQVEANAFHNGLVLNRHNKLPIKDAVYQVNSMNRHLFRPILTINHNGEDRELIGVNKWAESITVLATNGFQWNKAPDEWKTNQCFVQFLGQKGDEHDTLLEDQVIPILNKLKLPFLRNVVSFTDGGSNSVSVNVPNVGEMDFVWADPVRNRIVVADCKYNRSRYDMISFSADFSQFTGTYERKIGNKAKWIENNIELVYKNLCLINPGLVIDIKSCKVEKVFIINVPTFYMYIGSVNTVCFFNLETFVMDGYKPPDIAVTERTTTRSTIRIVKFPYFVIS